MSDHLRPQARPLARPAGLAEPLRPQARPGDLSGTAEPAAVAEAATLPDALPLDRTALLGVMDGPQGRHALLRLASGEVVRAGQGDVVGRGVVTRIESDALLLWQDGAEERLTLPA